MMTVGDIRHVISTPHGFVLEINRNHGTIVCVEKPEHARSFDTASKAKAWLNRYADCGYGMNSETAYVVTIEVVPFFAD